MKGKVKFPERVIPAYEAEVELPDWPTTPPTEPPPPPPPPTPPTVTMTATPSSVQAGQAVNLVWISTNAGSALLTDDHDIDGPDAVPASGSLTVHPDEPTQWTITVQGPGGSASAVASVSITLPPPPPPPVDPPTEPPPVDPPTPGPRPDSKIYFAEPGNLHTLIGDASPVKPGDEIHLRPGVYPGGNLCSIVGTPELPIRVRGLGGPRAVRIDCYKDRLGKDAWAMAGLEIGGGWVWYEDMEIMSSVPKPRRLGGSGSSPGSDFGRSNSVYLNRNVKGPGGSTRGIQLRNIVIHDTRGGPTGGNLCSPFTMSGCLVYNNGWASDRGHGHALYFGGSDSRQHWSIAEHNFAFRNLGQGLRFYGTGAKDAINAVLRGNVSWNSNEHFRADGLWTSIFWDIQSPGEGEGYIQDNLIFQMYKNAQGQYVADGHALGTGVPSQPPQKKSIVVDGNYTVGGDTQGGAAVQLWQYQQIYFRGNTTVAPGKDSVAFEYDGDPCVFENNKWYGPYDKWRRLMPTQSGQAWEARFGERFTELPTGLGGARFVPHPTNPTNCVRWAAVNWDLAPTVEIDLSEKFNAGDTVRVFSIEDFFGAPVHTQTLGADRKLTMPTSWGRAYPRMLGVAPFPNNHDGVRSIDPMFLAVEIERVA